MASPDSPSVDDVRAQLARVRYPGFARDIVSFGMVRNVEVVDGRVTVHLTVATSRTEVIERLRRTIEEEVRRLAGVGAVDVRPVAPERPASGQHGAFGRRAPLPGVTHIVAVASAKGGVGKSTVAVNLALALAAGGRKVGLLDADIYGPSVPHMLGAAGSRPRMAETKKIFPVERHGLAVISMGFFLDDRSPVIWRGPMVMSVVRQFLNDVVWRELDVLVVDLPPGTGDAQLTLVQEVPVSGGVIVTTPQDVALQDVKRGIGMFQTVDAPVVGMIENMSYYSCPTCGKREDIFASGGGRQEARALGIDFLGEIPLLPELRESMDRGVPLMLADPEHQASKTFGEIAARVVTALERGDIPTVARS